MKHSAAKTLGVAALGAAFAAAGAGSASAVAPGLTDAAGTVGNVASTLPVEEVGKALPAGAGQHLATGQQALAGGLSAASQAPAGEGDPVKGLIGGLPVGEGLPVQGLPLGG
ncbi:ATP-binding protein [Streptomyces cavernicola]|uniref:ATP-binding protein n=1 Tax=Streptomyces cavernicola TaxID=3043613 RepID=A0ABT6SMA3_9ACTN|nr:ATP-binding protein [Streptomyces sp. B-S-A6]MDI3409315.1 ATP-binding protein [Streptomyces sp. B-S-A6]